MKIKRIILIVLLIVPSLIYFFFELSKVNFKKMRHYGPVQLAPNGKDSIYYRVPSTTFYSDAKLQQASTIDSTHSPVYLIGFLQEKEETHLFRLKAIFEYYQLKPKDIQPVDIYLILPSDSSGFGEKYAKLLPKENNLHVLYAPKATFTQSLGAYQNGKPHYIMPYFFQLIDRGSCIRGFYDPEFVSQVKQMISEYQHLKIRDEHQKMMKDEEITSGH